MPCLALYIPQAFPLFSLFQNAFQVVAPTDLHYNECVTPHRSLTQMALYIVRKCGFMSIWVPGHQQPLIPSLSCLSAGVTVAQDMKGQF